MDAAAWVQAVGSILAVLSGFAFVSFQNGQEKRSRVQALVGLIEAVLLLSNSHKRVSIAAADCAEFSVVCRRAACDLAAMREVIFNVDLSAIDSGDVWTTFATFVTGLDQLIAQLNDEADNFSNQNAGNAVRPVSISSVGDRLRFMAEVSGRLFHAAEKHYGVLGPRRQQIFAIVEQLKL